MIMGDNKDDNMLPLLFLMMMMMIMGKVMW